MRTDAKLSKLVEFYKERLDRLYGGNEFDRGAYVAFSIAMIMTREIVWQMLDETLTLNEGDEENV